MLIRVRSNVGVWRIDGLSEESATVQTVLDAIALQRPHVVYEKALSEDAACAIQLDTVATLSQQGMRHGSMVYCRVDAATTVDISVPAALVEASATAAEDVTMTEAAGANSNSNVNANMRRIIDKDGCIKLVPGQQVRDAGQDRGFRRGMMPLRDMKLHWTLNDFLAMDSQFEFKIQRQLTAITKKVSLDIPSTSNFQSYLQRFQFKRKRYAFLYGKFVKESEDDEKPTKVMVEAIYEPPQEVDATAAEGFQVLEDPDETKVNDIAALLGLTRVGWIFGHEPRPTGYVLSSAEVIMAAEFQLEAAGGVEETPFCTCAVSQGQDGLVSVEAFQVSQQCMAMVAEEALEIFTDDPKFTKVNETFTAIQEGKASPTVENNFFLTVVPIVQHTSETFVADFPRPNRDLDDRVPSHDEMKRHLQQSGSAGWTFEDRLADFSLLLYLSKFLDIHADFPKICASVVDRSVPLDDGYKLIIKSMAGMDGSY